MIHIIAMQIVFEMPVVIATPLPAVITIRNYQLLSKCVFKRAPL